MVGIGKLCNILILLKFPQRQILFINTYKGCCNICKYFFACSSLEHIINTIDCVIPQLSINTLYLSVVDINILYPS